MRNDGRAFLVLTAAVGACAALAGCASGASAQKPAASTLTTRQGESQRQGHVTRPPQASATSKAAGNDTPTTQASQPTVAPAAESHPPSSIPAMLTSGLYTDAPDGTSHYVLSFAPSADNVIRGSASFLYQDGRIVTVGSYVGTLSGRGKITLTLGDGKVLSGSYTTGRLNLSSCAAALPMVKVADGCTFTYHGHVP